MTRQSLAASLALAAALTSAHAFSAVIVQNTAGGITGPVNVFFGQSFTTPSGGPWDDITFNFFSDFPATTPVAFGTAFLLDQQYLGTPSDLSASTPGFLGASTGITGGMYVFPSSLVLDPDVRYFVYENALIATDAVSGGSFITGELTYTSISASGDFGPVGNGPNFALSGTVVSGVPEPCPLMILVTALLGFGFLPGCRKRALSGRDHLRYGI